MMDGSSRTSSGYLSIGSKPPSGRQMQFVHRVVFPAEGGWGWMVCATCSVMAFLMVGTASAQGSLLLSLERHLQLSSVIWIASARNAATFVVVPVGRRLCRHLGWRVGCFVGSSLCSLGYLLTSVATSLRFCILSLGLALGAGTGLCLTVCLLVLEQHFNQRRDAAQALVLVGAGVGLTTFGIATDALLRVYDLQIVLLVTSGACLLPLAALPFLRSAPKHVTLRFFLSPHRTLASDSDLRGLRPLMPVRQETRIKLPRTPQKLPSSSTRVSILGIVSGNFSFDLLLIAAILVGGLAFPHAVISMPLYGRDWYTGVEMCVIGVFFFLGLAGPVLCTRWTSTDWHAASTIFLTCGTLGLLPRSPSRSLTMVSVASMGLGLSMWGWTLPDVVRHLVGREAWLAALDTILVLQGLSSLLLPLVAVCTEGMLGNLSNCYLTAICSVSGLIVTFGLVFWIRCRN